MENERYEYSPIVTRKIFNLPDSARIAVWVIPNIEYFEFDVPCNVGMVNGRVPDVSNYGWRDYGARVGVWRIMDVLDKYGMRATVALNSAVCKHYPIIIEEGKKRDWEFMGHAITNSRYIENLSAEEERQVIRTAIQQITDAVGKPPEGWLSPGLAETFNTPDILAEEGIRYLCDWCSDDQPYPIKVRKGQLISIPYSYDINDIPALLFYHRTPEEVLSMIKEQFDVLYEEGAKNGKVMAISLHPWLTGAPFRIRYLDKALEYITQHSDVWLATGSEIANWYYDHYL